MSDDFEKQFWGKCINTYGEEEKQLVYARYMGLISHHNGFSPYNFDMHGQRILDIGGGPVSLLLKCTNLGADSTVIDPLRFPAWVYHRYKLAKIDTYITRGEDATPSGFEHFHEAWIYNVLQHVDDPQLVITNARALASKIRLFEWLDLPPHPGHPHELRKHLLDEWLGAPGQVVSLNESGCTGLAYYGVWDGTKI